MYYPLGSLRKTSDRLIMYSYDYMFSIKNLLTCKFAVLLLGVFLADWYWIVSGAEMMADGAVGVWSRSSWNCLIMNSVTLQELQVYTDSLSKELIILPTEMNTVFNWQSIQHTCYLSYLVGYRNAHLPDDVDEVLDDASLSRCPWLWHGSTVESGGRHPVHDAVGNVTNTLNILPLANTICIYCFWW